MLRWPTFTSIVLLSLLLRITLIAYSEYFDALPDSTVKYTDVDYRVFTDAARFVLSTKDEHIAQGPLGKYLRIGDPYQRPTYRYTPLLAVILTPNIFFHSSFGKFLFVVCDIIMGVILYRLAQRGLKKESANFRVSLLHLLNPLIFSISTRGSSESVLGLFVIMTLYYSSRGRWDATAVWFGLSVHWKIYPIIYGSSLLMILGEGRRDWALKSRLRFALISGSTFFMVGGAMYAIWGFPFLEHTYIYHLGRRDHRHNFSPYFYPIYLSLTLPPSKWSIVSNPLMSFIPQILLSVGSGFLLARRRSDLPFVWFVQTVLFVAFNKVCTSQYFLWYLWFLPLIVPKLKMSIREALFCLALWAGTQAIWLSLAYRLEFLGENVFLPLWATSLAFFVVHCFVLIRILKAYQF